MDKGLDRVEKSNISIRFDNLSHLFDGDFKHFGHLM